MSIARYIKEIGRGSRGARALNTEQAQDLMAQVLQGAVTDLEIGAFCVAMRIKGETPAELAGFLAATQPFCLAPRSARTQVWLPSYNGARKLPNLTPLLALLLARQGVPVLVHGPLVEPGRVSTAEVFSALGLSIASGAADIAQAWQRNEPAFVPTEALCLPLARLLHVRRIVGLRNPGHTVAKVLCPPTLATSAAQRSAVFRVVNHTHPEYAELLSRFLAETRADAMLLRGTEGEPVADARRTPRMQVFLGGEQNDAWGVAAREGALIRVPEVPDNGEAPGTAGYIGAVMSGGLSAPEPIAAQVECILQALKLADATNFASTPR
jgi:anthranilate phosphoribosyltransferase